MRPFAGLFLLSALATAQTDISLSVRTAANQTVFHVGEVIPIELSFTSSAPKTYQLDMASYDRSGRLGMDTFAVQPETGWDDPLFLYFHAYSGFIGGGLRGFQALSPQPTVVKEEMNEWVRFRQPGTYRITVTSTRASRLGVQAMTPVSVTSNEISLTIVPATSEWLRETFEKAMAGLKPGSVGPSLNGPAHDAVKALRYLGTAEAAEEMAVRLDDPAFTSDFQFGLLGSPGRAATRDALRRLLLDPTFAVSSRFLATLSILSLPDAASSTDLPVQRQQAEAALRQELTAALPSKRGTALAISLNTILENADALPGPLKTSLTTQLAAHFDQLPMEQQAGLLQSRWKSLDQAAMGPLLQKIAERYQFFPVLNEMNAWNFNNASAAALQHWYEIDPAAARPAVLREILRPEPRFGASILGLLPDRELPDAEQALAAHLAESRSFGSTGNIASLLHRYAGPAAEPAVTAYLDPLLGKLACAVQEPLLAYLLKVDPDAARPRIAKAMEAHGTGFSACNRYLLVEVAQVQNDPLLEEFAIQALDNADPQIVANAATYLAKYGSAGAEQTLWSHLEAWSRKWAGKEAELQFIPGEMREATFDNAAGSNMLQALATAQSWLADEPKLRRLMELAVGQQQKQQAENYLKSWQHRPWTIQLLAFDKNQFTILQYEAKSLDAAKAKIRQFPAGSVFQFFGEATPEAARSFHDLSTDAAAHGTTITR